MGGSSVAARGRVVWGWEGRAARQRPRWPAPALCRCHGDDAGGRPDRGGAGPRTNRRAGAPRGEGADGMTKTRVGTPSLARVRRHQGSAAGIAARGGRTATPTPTGSRTCASAAAGSGWAPTCELDRPRRHQTGWVHSRCPPSWTCSRLDPARSLAARGPARHAPSVRRPSNKHPRRPAVKMTHLAPRCRSSIPTGAGSAARDVLACRSPSSSAGRSAPSKPPNHQRMQRGCAAAGQGNGERPASAPGWPARSARSAAP